MKALVSRFQGSTQEGQRRLSETLRLTIYKYFLESPLPSTVLPLLPLKAQ
jgi:hypothetical protein